MVLLYAMRRVRCKTCGVKVEEVPWGMGKHIRTEAYMLYLAHWARKISRLETARTFHISWEKVFQSVEYVAQWGLAHRRLDSIRAIGINEIAVGKGQKYLTLVYQIDSDCKRLLWVGQERTKKSFEQFFTVIGKKLADHIEFVCTDIWRPYLDVTAEQCPNALNILDRFHVVAKINKAIDEVRAGEARPIVKDGFDPVLKKSR